MNDIKTSWTWSKVMMYIENEVSESLQLDFKAAPAISKMQSKKAEITKDVSAMANSAGGVIIYGITEENSKTHSIDPIDNGDYGKEWLEQIIDGVHPRINGVQVHRIQNPKDTSQTVYAVDVPQSNTAHQANDKRYHKRQDTHTIAMMDYEIRDVMGRTKNPKLELEFLISPKSILENKNELFLWIYLKNMGDVLAKYIHGTVVIPSCMIAPDEGDVIGNRSPFSVVSTQVNNLSDNNFIPLLPRTYTVVKVLKLVSDSEMEILSESLYSGTEILPSINWMLFADNSLPKQEQVTWNEIKRELSELELTKKIFNPINIPQRTNHI